MVRRRARRTQAQIEQLEKQIYAVLLEDHPQSVRHVYYRMTDPRLPEHVEKTEGGYRTVQRRILDMRRENKLNYSWVSDSTRRGYFTDVFNGKAEFIRRVSGLYRGDLWRYSGFYCEIWVESRSLAGVIQSLCEELAVSLYPAGGFTSATLPFEAANFINQEAEGRKVKIFYIGDFDPAGVLIDVSIERELRRHLNPDAEMTFTRIGITPAQIAKYNLPTKPRKDGDRRSKHIEQTVEAESLPAKILRDLLRANIESLLPAGAIRVTKIAEQSEKAWFDNWARMLDEESAHELLPWDRYRRHGRDCNDRRRRHIDRDQRHADLGRRSKRPLLAEIIFRSHATAAFVEFVGARPGEGAVGAFSFGRSRGVVEGVLAAAGVPATMLTSPTWKRAVGIAPGKEGAKDAARSEAIRRWPAHAGLFARVKDDGRAEACLIGIAGLMRAGGAK
jgi:hypothetical protein